MNFSKKSVEDVEVRGKRILLRADFDVPVSETGEVVDNHHLLASLTTIQHLLAKGARSIVLISHRGVPNGKRDETCSLRGIATCLGDLLGRSVTFLENRIGDEIEEACANPPHGTVILLENLRFNAEEEGEELLEGPVPKREDIELFRGRLDALGDIYVNDAFAIMHSTHSSIVGVDLPEMVLGLSAKQELAAFRRTLCEPVKPMLAILGGTTIKQQAIEHLVEIANSIILCGGPAFAFLKGCQRMETGCSVFDETLAEHAPKIMSKARSKGCEIMLPVDWMCGQHVDGEMHTQLFTESQGIPEGWTALDCGPRSMELFVARVHAAKTVLWHGPVGQIEKGSRTLLEAVVSVSATGGFTMIVDSELAAAAVNWMQSTVSFTSRGGAASMKLLEGVCLPGIAILSEKPRELSWQGNLAGKYTWDNSPKVRSADEDMMDKSDKISRYSWSDGKKRVSIYIELDDAHCLNEEAFKVSNSMKDVSLVIEPRNGKRRAFALVGLCHEISSARVVQKKDKNMLSLQLQKKEERPWPQLLENKAIGAREEEDDLM